MMTDRPAVVCAETKRLRDTVQVRIGQTFDMFGGGETRDLFLRVSSRAARYIYDRFGHNTMFEHIANDGTYGFVHIRAKPSQTFYRWLFGMGDKVVLAEPKGHIWEDAFREGGNLAKSHDQLMEDYRFTIADMRKYVCEFAHIYDWKLV